MDSKMKTKKFRIGGMTCVNCQNKIEKKLRNTAGVESAKVSYSAGTAEVAFDTDIISFKDICAIIENLDYHVLSENEKLHPNTSHIIGTLVIIVALYVLMQQFGILNLLVPSRLASAGTGYGMLFIIGLITSVHCIAMCGGINLSQCLPHSEEADSQIAGQGNGNRLSTFVPAFLYNLGRVISYTVVGFVLGAAGMLLGGGGSGSGLPTFAQGILKIIAGVFMVIMGVNMLGIFPWFRKLQPSMPKFLTRKVNTEKARSKSPLIVGLLNGLMPCGPLQSMQIVALASGNPFAGALSMFLFSLGTVPLMLGLGSIVSALGHKFTKRVMSVGAVLVVVLGLAMLSQGGSLSGLLPPNLLFSIILALCAVGIVSSIPFRSASSRVLPTAVVSVVAIIAVTLFGSGAFSNTANAQSGGNVNIVDGKQLVSSTLSSGSYPNITVQEGTPVKWVINAPQGSINGCNDKINIQAFGISNYEFKNGENVIEFTPTKTGKFDYSCWMGMIRGTITVTEAGAVAANTSEPAASDDTGSSSAGLTAPIPAGYKIPTDNVAIAKETTYQGVPVQEVTVELTDQGFSPAVVVVKSGLYVMWDIKNSVTGTGNGTQLLVPNYASQLKLEQADNQLAFNPDSSFDFSTGDSKFYGYVKVVDDVSKADIAAIKKEVNDFQTLIYPPETFQASGSASNGASGQAVKATVKDGVQYVTSSVTGGGYEPIQVQKGLPVKWTLKAPSGSLTSCNNAIVIPEYNLQIKLKTGDNLIEFTPDKSGTFAFSCWMGMVRSAITVANADGSVDATADDGSSRLPSCCGGGY